MRITIPSYANLHSIKTAFPAPRGATHFRFTAPGHKPVIDALRNIDILVGCSGKLEFGKASFNGRGRHAKITGFTVSSVAAVPSPAPEPAPEQSAPEPSQTPSVTLRPKKGRLNGILGFSACAVAKALGSAGVKYDEAARIFHTHGIEMPKASLSVQLGFGRNSKSWERHGNPAPLTPEQIDALRAQATQ